MTYLSSLSRKGSAAGTALLLGAAVVARAGDCASPGLPALVAAEHAFAEAARSSVRQAFLDNLADEAWVLQPGPTPAKAWYQSHPDGPGTLSWYPRVAALAPAGDLGFTSGPYVYAREGTQAFGQFLTLWRRVEDCRWRVVFDGGIAHARLPDPPAVDATAPAAQGTPRVPPEDVVTAFQAVTAHDGLGAALRTYARNEGFLLLLDGKAPMGLGSAARELQPRIVTDVWREAVRGQSRDGALLYAVGSLGGGAYAQIWQYDPRTANLGLRVLLLTSP